MVQTDTILYKFRSISQKLALNLKASNINDLILIVIRNKLTTFNAFKSSKTLMRKTHKPMILIICKGKVSQDFDLILLKKTST